MNQILVYGTLKRGFPNHLLLEDGGAEYISDFVTSNQFFMYDLGHFPGVTDGGFTSITGEVYRVSDDLLRTLDYFEGHPKHFERRKLPFLFRDKPIEMYHFNMNVGKMIPMKRGVWMRR